MFWLIVAGIIVLALFTGYMTMQAKMSIYINGEAEDETPFSWTDLVVGVLLLSIGVVVLLGFLFL